MATKLTPDICVIGGGAGGYAVALAAAAGGVSVVLIERSAPGGGPIRHCMPMHALLSAAAHAQAMRKGARFGIANVEPEIDFHGVARHVRNATAAATPDRSAERLGALGVMVLHEQARFADRRTVLAGEYEISARRFVIATGAEPAPITIPGIETVEPLTPETHSSLTRRPGRLIIVGSGPYALAFAQAYRRLGSEVVLICEDSVLPGHEPEHAALVLDALRMEGVDIREETRAHEIARRGKTGVRINIRDRDGSQKSIDGTHLLAVPQYMPALDGLDLEKAGIAFTAAGITVDAGLRTGNKLVHAIGDVTGRGSSVQRAEQDATRVAATLLRHKDGTATPAPCPRVIFTSPQIAAVGLGEMEARQLHRQIRILRWPLSENDRARAGQTATGFIKLIAGEDGSILGVSIASEDAGELIGPWVLAIANGLSVAEMARHPTVYPSHAEIGKRAATSYFAQAARKAGLRRYIPFLR